MAVFQRLARPVILSASRSNALRNTIERFPITAKVVNRFVPGEHVADVIASVRSLRESGLMVSIDYLGEDVTDTAAATATVAAYTQLLDTMAATDDSGAVRPLEVSLKLSAMGQALPYDGEKIALENARIICAAAQRLGVWVTIDAEDHTTTDSTLSIVRELRAEFDSVGTVLQAYLKRTYTDCQEFAASSARIRLCKGAYDEPASVAYRDSADVTDSYLRCLQVLMAGTGYPMVASHDPTIIEAVPSIAQQANRGLDAYEYQMLFGIREPEQQRLADAGNNMRVYVPFGTQWYGYFMRRLAERPANLAFFLRALAQRGASASA